MPSKLCESCVHTKVCMLDKNLVGDVFVMGNPDFFDNKKLYEEYKKREEAGFPCNEYLTADVKPVVRGKWIKHNEVKVFINGESSTGGVMCSACGYKTHNKAHTQIGCPFNFCPNCGAEMVRGDSK